MPNRHAEVKLPPPRGLPVVSVAIEKIDKPNDQQHALTHVDTIAQCHYPKAELDRHAEVKLPPSKGLPCATVVIERNDTLPDQQHVTPQVDTVASARVLLLPSHHHVLQACQALAWLCANSCFTVAPTSLSDCCGLHVDR